MWYAIKYGMQKEFGYNIPQSIYDRLDSEAFHHFSRLLIEPKSMEDIREYTDDDDHLDGVFVPSISTIYLNENTLEHRPEVSLYTLVHELAHALQPCIGRGNTQKAFHAPEFRHTLLSLVDSTGLVRKEIIQQVQRGYDFQNENNLYRWETPLRDEFRQIQFYPASALPKTKNSKPQGGLGYSAAATQVKAFVFNGEANLFEAFKDKTDNYILTNITKLQTADQKQTTQPKTPFILCTQQGFIYGDGVQLPVELSIFEVLFLLMM
jgi:hypothetical protein